LIKVISETVLILVGGTAVLAILFGIRVDCFVALVRVETLESGLTELYQSGVKPCAFPKCCSAYVGKWPMADPSRPA
jgi:hypothetical protein